MMVLYPVAIETYLCTRDIKDLTMKEELNELLNEIKKAKEEINDKIKEIEQNRRK